MAKEIPNHVDKLNVEIKVDQVVVTGYSTNSLIIARVMKLNPKMLTLKAIGSKSTFNRYPADVVILDSGPALMYVLGKDL